MVYPRRHSTRAYEVSDVHDVVEAMDEIELAPLCVYYVVLNWNWSNYGCLDGEILHKIECPCDDVECEAQIYQYMLTKAETLTKRYREHTILRQNGIHDEISYNLWVEEHQNDDDLNFVTKLWDRSIMKEIERPSVCNNYYGRYLFMSLTLHRVPKGTGDYLGAIRREGTILKVLHKVFNMTKPDWSGAINSLYHSLMLAD